MLRVPPTDVGLLISGFHSAGLMLSKTFPTTSVAGFTAGLKAGGFAGGGPCRKQTALLDVTTVAKS